MKHCLLLVNIQNDHFDGGKLPIPNAWHAVQQAAEALQCFRDHQKPFMHIQSVERIDPSKPFYTGTKGILFHAHVPHFENEPIGFKFEDGILPTREISAFIDRSECSQVILCYFGSTSEYHNYLQALSALGHQTMLIRDGSAFSDQKGEPVISASLEEIFLSLTNDSPQNRAEIPATVLYNPINNVLPKDK